MGLFDKLKARGNGSTTPPPTSSATSGVSVRIETRPQVVRDLWQEQFDGLERLKTLKREGDLEGARALALEMVDRAEALCTAEGGIPAPAYTLEAAIVLRKLHDYDAEVAVLERYIELHDAADPARQRTVETSMKKIQQRVVKACSLREGH